MNNGIPKKQTKLILYVEMLVAISPVGKLLAFGHY